MTPQERDLIVDLFDRLAQLERNPRDADAERAIREGLQRAPNAIYALVQSVLVQDEALRAANDHIADLEDELSRGAPGGQPGQNERPRSFLDGVRDTVFGRDDQPRGGGSVPSIGRARPMGAPAGYGERRDNPGNPWGQARDAGAGPSYAGGPGGPGGPGYGGPGGPAPGGGGGGFLGTAAAVAAGAIGSSLLMGGIRSALGSQTGGQGGAQGNPLGGALDHLRGGGAGGGKVDPNSSLAQDAGLGDVGRGGRTNMAQADRQQDADQDQDDQQDEDDLQDEEQDGDFDDDDFESDDDDN
jgi:hypothetical protein